MIKFFGLKDERPLPSDLVGKLVGKEGIMRFRGYSLPLLVTAVSGKRLYAKACARGKADAILPTEHWTEETHFNLSQVAYVCDTIEEADLIRGAGKKSMQTYQRVQDELKAQMDAFFSEIASTDSSFDDRSDDVAKDDDGFYDSTLDKPRD
jgi:hypothetical protein